MKQLQLKTLSCTIKHDLIDKDFPPLSKEWKGIPVKHWEYYMIQLERMAKNNSFAIYKCKNMWCAKSLLQEASKQDANDSLLSSDNISETDGGELPIMVDVLCYILFFNQIQLDFIFKKNSLKLLSILHKETVYIEVLKTHEMLLR
ncbi:hypothetical protein F4703DRAFT_1797513 [Phycomyces blakesleeanus]